MRQERKIRIGFAGWSYPEWSGLFYPKPRPAGFQELTYLAQFFSVAEINSSFYRSPEPDWTERWAGQVEACPDFQFTAKLWRGFTHERNATPSDESSVRRGLAPLVRHRRLGALLMQFPWSFKNVPDRRAYLIDLIRRFDDYPLVIEVRHDSWNRPEIFAFLREQGAGICNIDQPLIGRSWRPSAHSTSAIGYVRVHGRNIEHWFTKNHAASERYDYLYTPDELAPWAQRIREIAGKAEVVYVIANNHPGAKSVVNAFQLENLVYGKSITAPATLVERYPQLGDIATPSTPVPATPLPGSLFPD